MKKLFPYILILVIITVILIPSFKVFASIVDETEPCDNPIASQATNQPCAPQTNYVFLAPLDSSAPSFDPTQPNALGGYLNLMIKLFIGICAVLAVVMIVIGGIEYMTSELISEKADGKGKIKGAVFGLVLALGAWTLLYTINPELLNTDLKSLTDVTVEVTIDDTVPQTPVDGKYKNGETDGAPWTGTPSVLVGVTTSPPGDCAKVGQVHCTSIKGLDVTYLNKIKAGCPSCQLVVTGGTEFWAHGGASGSTSHGKGSSTIDLRMNSALTSWIKSGTRKSPTSNRWIKDGISFLYENHNGVEHWHAGP